jgi:hypothetical protein
MDEPPAKVLMNFVGASPDFGCQTIG